MNLSFWLYKPLLYLLVHHLIHPPRLLLPTGCHFFPIFLLTIHHSLLSFLRLAPLHMSLPLHLVLLIIPLYLFLHHFFLAHFLLHLNLLHHLPFLHLLWLSPCHPLLWLLCLCLCLLRTSTPWSPDPKMAFLSLRLLQSQSPSLHPSLGLIIPLLSLSLIKLLLNFHNGAYLWMRSLLPSLDRKLGSWYHLHPLRML